MFSLGAVVSFQSVQRTEITILNLCVYFLRAHIKLRSTFGNTYISFQRIQEREREREIGRERERERERERGTLILPSNT